MENKSIKIGKWKITLDVNTFFPKDRIHKWQIVFVPFTFYLSDLRGFVVLFNVKIIWTKMWK